jgi:NRAMP (natural resistance-associated macrophage protein)-like metal ion transporter
MYWLSKSIHRLSRFRRQVAIFAAVLGPGFITMVADNDAGGISTYAVTGSHYGFSLLWIFILLVPIAFYIQEMTVRLGAVSKRGHAEAIFEGFGPVWGWFSLFDLAIVNWLTLVTEYIGMTAAASLFGVPPWLTFLGVTAILFAVVLTGRYWTFEKLTLFFCVFNLVYIPAALWAMNAPGAPGWNQVLDGFWRPEIPGGFTAAALFMILANVGTTITPWQLFFQQSAVVDKGLDVHDMRFGRWDTLAGALLTCVVAVFIIIVTGAALHFHQPPILIDDARQTADALQPLLPHGQGRLARQLFAIGLFDAGFLGALCISLSSSWALGEVMGWAHSLNRSVRDAPWFYVAYLAMLLTSGAVVLIPGAPLVEITMYVQVVAVTLLPVCLVFLLLLVNDEGFMGGYVNTRWQNIVNWSIVAVIILASTAFALSTLFPGLFPHA